MTVSNLPKLLFTSTEVAAKLGISRTKVYELMAGGQLHSVQIGRSRRVSTDALPAFVVELSER